MNQCHMRGCKTGFVTRNCTPVPSSFWVPCHRVISLGLPWGIGKTCCQGSFIKYPPASERFTRKVLLLPLIYFLQEMKEKASQRLWPGRQCQTTSPSPSRQLPHLHLSPMGLSKLVPSLSILRKAIKNACKRTPILSTYSSMKRPLISRSVLPQRNTH